MIKTIPENAYVMVKTTNGGMAIGILKRDYVPSYGVDFIDPADPFGRPGFSCLSERVKTVTLLAA